MSPQSQRALVEVQINTAITQVCLTKDASIYTQQACRHAHSLKSPCKRQRSSWLAQKKRESSSRSLKIFPKGQGAYPDSVDVFLACIGVQSEKAVG